MKVIEVKKGAVDSVWFRCPVCSYGTIMHGSHYCPGCGEEITGFIEKCHNGVIIGEMRIECELKNGHDGEHRKGPLKWE